MNDNPDIATEVFGFFNEIGIISQLSNVVLAKSLPDGVHPSHFAIINHLVRMGDGKPPVQIAAAMQVTKNTMTHSVKVLEQHQFITIRPDPQDGRGKLIYLTEKGRQFREQAVKQVSTAIKDVIGEEQRLIMARMKDDLAKLRKHLDENR